MWQHVAGISSRASAYLQADRTNIRLEVLGPAPAPLDRLCDRYRWQVLLKGRQIDELHRVCSGVLDKAGLLTAGIHAYPSMWIPKI